MSEVKVRVLRPFLVIGVKTRDVPEMAPPEASRRFPALGGATPRAKGVSSYGPEGRARYIRAEPETDPAPSSASEERKARLLADLARLRAQVGQVLAVFEGMAALRTLRTEDAVVEMALFAQSHERTARELEHALRECEATAQEVVSAHDVAHGVEKDHAAALDSEDDEDEAAVTQVDQTRPRVLLVDDEPAVLRAFRRVLASRYEVLTARDGAEALRTVVAGHVDAIVCDLEMPRLDGGGFFAELRELQPQLMRRVVFCAGGDPSEEVLRKLGTPHTLLRKPVSASQLAEAIDNARRG